MGRAADAGARFRVRVPTVMWDEIGGEIVAINLSSGHYFSLRTTACVGFRALAHGASIGEVAALVSDATTEPDTVAQDLDAFVEELLDAGLIEPRPDDVAIDAPAAPAVDAPGAYEAPHLETHTDLEDLMLLDPVHDVDGMGWPRARTEP